MIATEVRPRPIFVAGEWQDSPDVLHVSNPADVDRPAGATYQATAEQLEQATAAAVRAFETTRRSASYERGALLRAIADGTLERRDELARLISLEVAKPIRDTLVEAERTALAFRIAAEEAERIGGEVLRLDLDATSAGRWGITRRFPLGPVAAVSPFNLPLGLAVHKLAPAIAAGDPIVLKPPSKAPLALLALAEIIERAGAVPGSVSILPMSRELGDRMVADDRFRLFTFTGSPEVGWRLRAKAGRKKVVLELGGNAAAIVDRTADIGWAASRCLTGAFKFAGQLCVSIQRLLIHEEVYDEFMGRFVDAARALRTGDPLDPATEVSPMIDDVSLARIRGWIDDAVAAGGRTILGGDPDRGWLPPTILADVPVDARICTDEAFAPIVIVSTFSDFDDAIASANDSQFGLQTGVFTNDLDHAWRAFEGLEVGGVMINDIPGYRIDSMPFGGVKESGAGREGIRWAIEDMTELRLMVMAQPS